MSNVKNNYNFGW